MNRIISALAIAHGCGGPAPPPTTSPLPPPPPVAIEESTPAPQAAAASEAVGPPTDVPEACRGTDLDLQTIFSDTVCDVPEATEDMPSERLSLSLSPAPVDMKSNAKATVNLVMRNMTDGWLRVGVEIGCGIDFEFPVEIWSGDGRVDFESACGGLLGCMTRHVQIALAPSGTARLARSFYAKVKKQSADCKRWNVTPLPAGTYSLRVATPFREGKDRRFGAGVLRVL